MLTFLKAFVVAIVVFLVLDAIWLGIVAKELYKSHLGFLMNDSVRWGAAALFYVLFIIGLVTFAVLPALRNQDIWLALGYGALFGLICYATYDLTNYATLRGWPLKIVVYDISWGAVISAVSAGAAYFITSLWK